MHPDISQLQSYVANPVGGTQMQPGPKPTWADIALDSDDESDSGWISDIDVHAYSSLGEELERYLNDPQRNYDVVRYWQASLR
jgi:hypothetical protein